MTIAVGTGSDDDAGFYDVVVVGGAIMGSSIAWFLTANPDFDGEIAVIERDPTFARASTSHTNSCMRQQFSTELNVRISQFGAEFVSDFVDHMVRAGADPADIPELAVDHFGYMYLAADHDFARILVANQKMQAGLGAGTRIWTPDQIAEAYPFYNVADIVCGSHNLVDEGYFDGGTMFSTWRREARRNGAEFISDEVVGFGRSRNRVTGVSLASGRQLAAGTVVNASGTSAAPTAALAGIADVPIEPRKRFTWIFECAEPLPCRLPLTIDPSGVHVRSDGDAYMSGCGPDLDHRVDLDDFAMDGDLFEDKVWPALAHRVPAFERIKVTNRWAGHYAYNTLDHNAVVGPHPDLVNFVFATGFSGHGLQQSPAVGRGIAELVTYGEYRSLDLSALGYDRVIDGRPLEEIAII